MTMTQVRSIRNIPWLMTMEHSSDSQVGLIENAAVLIEADRVVWLGDNDACPKIRGEGVDLDASGSVAMPGLIDCHTHLVFGGDRAQDFYDRARGTSYAQIMARGGGIQHSVAMTRSATKSDLFESAMHSLKRMLARGVTTAEVKSGYGLNLDDEIKVLEVVQELNKLQPVTLVPTFLGAHSVPLEYQGRSSDYVEYLIHTVLPLIARRKLAQAVDVFVEKGAFSVDEGRKLLMAAKQLGFKLKVHADQLSPLGGTALAAEVSALSVSHLEYASDAHLTQLANAGVVAEVLPLAELYLGVPNVVNVRELVAKGVKVAVATDYNPGTAMCDDLQLAMRLAVTQRKMSVEEAFLGITHHAACALGEQKQIGQISVGMQADLCLFEGRSPWSLAYDWTHNPVRMVVKAGKLVV